jgi:hypothetical protein
MKYTWVRLIPRGGPTGLVTYSITVFRRVQKKKHEHTGFYIRNAAGIISPLKPEVAMKKFFAERNRETL